MENVLKTLVSFFNLWGPQLASFCAQENLNLNTNRSKFSMLLRYANETTVVGTIKSMTNINSRDEFILSNAPSKKLSYSLTPVLNTLFIECI